MQELLTQYQKAEKYLRCRLKECDKNIKMHINFIDGNDVIRMRCIYERELYEVLIIINDIKSYIKETNK